MTLERVKAILHAYGSEPRRWPAGERAGALALLERHRTALEADLAEAARIDQALSPTPNDGADTALERAEKAAIDSFASAQAKGTVVHGNFGVRRTWVRACAALAACAVLGVVIGYADGGQMHALEDIASLDAAFDFTRDGGAWASGGGQ